MANASASTGRVASKHARSATPSVSFLNSLAPQAPLLLPFSFAVPLHFAATMADPREEELRQELSDCVMNNWFFCVAGVALAVPIGVRMKSYMPVVALGLAGTMLDILNGYDKCKDQRAALESYMRSKEAFGQQHTSLEHHLARQQAAAAQLDRQQGGGEGD
ncbi:hypothetical protein ABPG77_004816 [Micractinium sp. CCAP 211/92]